MKKVGAGIVLVREDNEEISFYLHEDFPSFQAALRGKDRFLYRMSFERFEFFSSGSLVCYCCKNRWKPDELIIEKDIEFLLKVLPYVVENIRKHTIVSVSPKVLLNILENGDPSAKYRELKKVVEFFLSVEPTVLENIFRLEGYSKPILYYTTEWNDKRLVVVTKREILKYSNEPAIASFLKEVREKILWGTDYYDEKRFLEELNKKAKEVGNDNRDD